MIYFIKCHATGLIKIGCATDPISRLRALQIGSASRLEMLGVTNGGMGREKEIHAAFAAARRRGEWFEASEQLVDFIFNLPPVIEHPHPNELRKQGRVITRLLPARAVPQRNRVNNRRLTADEVHEIFVALASGETPQVLARRYNVQVESVYAIKARKRHFHLLGAEHHDRGQTIRLRFPKTAAEREAWIRVDYQRWPMRHIWTYSSAPK